MEGTCIFLNRIKTKKINPNLKELKQYDKIHRIRHVDSGAGFCALITFALNGIKRALENNMLPVIDYSNHEVNNYFYDPNYGENVWEYYFEPVMGVSAKELVLNKSLSNSQIHEYPEGLILRWHTHEEGRIATFWGAEKNIDPPKYMAKKRALGRFYVQKYLKVKPRILEKVEDFYKNHLDGHVTIGVHIRGTDFAYAKPTSIETYFEEIQSLDNKMTSPSEKIFLATDQVQFVHAFKKRYGTERVVTYSARRSETEKPIFFDKSVSGYLKGEDVLIDILLLSRTDYLLKGASAVGEYAMWFNPRLKCTDFALKSKFDPSHSTSAYLKLNIAEWNTMRWRIQYLISKLLLTFRLSAKMILDFGLNLGKKVLPKSVRKILWDHIFRHLYY